LAAEHIQVDRIQLLPAPKNRPDAPTFVLHVRLANAQELPSVLNRWSKAVAARSVPMILEHIKTTGNSNGVRLEISGYFSPPSAHSAGADASCRTDERVDWVNFLKVINEGLPRSSGEGGYGEEYDGPGFGEGELDPLRQADPGGDSNHEWKQGGTLEIVTSDNNVRVSILRDGQEVRILDTKTGNTVTLDASEYDIRLSADRGDLQLRPDRVTMKRGKKVIVEAVRISRKQTKPKGAVQWKTSDGGNGHFYQVVAVPEEIDWAEAKRRPFAAGGNLVTIASKGISWTEANRRAIAAGGHLVTITSKAENDFVFALADHPEYWERMDEGPWMMGPWIGAVQAEGAREPDGGWQWVTPEPFVFADWGPVDPNDDCKASGAVNRICFYHGAKRSRSGLWVDAAINSPYNVSYVIEFDRFETGSEPAQPSGSVSSGAGNPFAPTP